MKACNGEALQAMFESDSRTIFIFKFRSCKLKGPILRRARVPCRKSRLLLFLAGYGGLEPGTSGELGNGGRGDLERSTGLRILASACSALGGFESAKTYEG